MGRHAYLIMAHGLIGQLSRLLKALDHERNDFYLHIDEKCVDSISSLESLSLKGNLYFTDRIKVNWGGQAKYMLSLYC